MGARTATLPPGHELAADRAKRLFHYIQEIAKLQSRSVYDMDASTAYEEILWLGRLPDDPECHSQARGDPMEPGEWLVIRRPRFSPPPQLPEELEPWVEAASIRDSSGELVLKLRATILRESDDGSGELAQEEQHLDDQPEIQELFEMYRGEWRPWAEEDARLKPIHNVYSSVYQMYRRSTDEQERYEVVLGLGLATKQIGNARIRRPILVARADVDFDDQTGQLTVRPAGDGMDLHVETDMLDEADIPGADQLAALNERLIRVDDPLGDEDVEAVLTSFAHLSGTTARYDASNEPLDAGEHLVIAYAPVLTLRRRSRRALVDFCSGVLERLDAGVEELPPSIRDIIELGDDEDWNREPSADAEPIAEPLFPLPSNDEQRKIAERLERANGLVVEGPPGTGKSHTIANLISHLTAHGKRVLVTSHTARALTVVKDKLPQGISELCVDVLGEGRERRDNLERSVTALLARHTDPDWQKSKITERLNKLEKRRTAERERRSELVAEQRRARRLEVDEQDPGIEGYAGSRSAIAAKIRAEEGAWSWFTDEAIGPPPNSLAKAAALLDAERSTTPADEEQARLETPDMEKVPEPAEVRKALEDIDELERRADDLSTDADSVSKAVVASDSEKRAALNRSLQRWTAARREARNRRGEWVERALGDLGAGREGKWLELQRLTTAALERIGEDAPNLDRIKVTGVTPTNRARLRSQAIELRDHFATGGGLGRLRQPQPVKQAGELLESVRVAGRRPDTEQILRALITWMDADANLDRIFAAWGGHLRAGSSTVAEQRVALADQLDDLNAVLAVNAARKEVDEATGAILGVDSPDWSDDRAALAFVDAVRLGEAMAAAGDARRKLATETELLRVVADKERAAPAVSSARRALADHDPASYARAYEALEGLRQTRARVEARDELRATVAAAVPRLATAIFEDPFDEAWDMRVRHLRDAWEWRRANAWLETADVVREEAAINRDLIEVDAQIRRLTGDIAENMAWRAAISRLSPAAQRELRAWQASMRSYGKGTGKNAQRHLREARQHLDACQDAVPVWVMPTHVVAQTVPPEPGTFDVVIVDEASQSSVDSSFLMWLGKKVIIVGDDRQISPDSVGLDRDTTTRLADMYLGDFSLKSVLGIENSLFTQATVRYTDRIRLREHFRCMPEIIDFSNKVAYYDQPLIPLRQYGSERLEPLMARYVEGGEMTGSSANRRNEREAEQIVSTMKRLIADPAYKGKTMGVVSMLGGAQARHIEQLLVPEISAKEMSERRIRCGDAYTFQGDERDVMFLSLVVSPPSDGSKVRVATERTFLQRFNVACSRAKDQEWLFHSVELGDLKTQDLRYKLVAHFVAPTSEETLREIADIPDDRVVEPFDSVFEQRVYKDIRARGFRVDPQVHVHDYRIDLVITGRDRKLAVECDGDRWHGPDQFARDASRQRDLERCGWSFVRIRGGDYFRDPVGALEPLWAVLDEHQIHPGGQEPAREEPPTERLGERPDDRGESRDAGAAPRPRELVAPSGGAGAELLEPSEAPTEELDELAAAPAVELETAAVKSTGVAVFVAWSSGGRRPHLRASHEQVARVLQQIVEAEGPIDRELLFARFVRATGRRRVSAQAREHLVGALELAASEGQVTVDEVLTHGAAWSVVRMPGTLPVVIRDRGNRDLVEIPANEVAAMMVAISLSAGVARGEALKRGTLSAYGRTRLTEKASVFLDHCAELVNERQVRAAGRALAAAISERIESIERAQPAAAVLAAAPWSKAVEIEEDEEIDDNEEEEPGETGDVGAAGPPFWELAMSTIRDARTLFASSAEAIAALWSKADHDPQIKGLRSAAIELGAEPEWSDVAKFVRSELTDADGEFRGAVVDITYMGYWRSHRGRGAGDSIADGWPKRLEMTWREAVAEADDRAVERAEIVCIHGEPRGHCSFIACPHHALGGMDLYAEM